MTSSTPSGFEPVFVCIHLRGEHKPTALHVILYELKRRDAVILSPHSPNFSENAENRSKFSIKLILSLIKTIFQFKPRMLQNGLVTFFM